MCVALISALTKNPARPDVAMTGEVTLRGRVLAVGGLKEKILAARQQGIKIVLVPDENRDDVEEIMKEIGKSDHLDVVYVKNMDEVLKFALARNPFHKTKIEKKAESKKQEADKKERAKKKAPLKAPAKRIRIA